MLKSVKKKISEWVVNNQPKTNFKGTNADFQTYRERWINNCSSSNSTGLLQSKKNAYGQCQSYFDNATNTVQQGYYIQNAEQSELLKQGTEYLMYGLVLCALTVAIIWLLTSK